MRASPSSDKSGGSVSRIQQEVSPELLERGDALIRAVVHKVEARALELVRHAPRRYVPHLDIVRLVVAIVDLVPPDRARWRRRAGRRPP